MKSVQLRSLALLVAVGAALGAVCSSGLGQTPAAQAAVVQSSASRVAAPKVPDSDLADLSKSNSSFAFDLYSQLKGKEGNLFYSPYSISAALAMTYAGARGDTEGEMARVLHYDLPQDRLHPAFNALDQTLASRGKEARGKDGQGFRLKIANSIWGQTDYRFKSDYLDTLARNYGAGLRLLDFQQSPEPARSTINDWVDTQTEGKITDLLQPGSIDGNTRLVLTNAIYFNAAWRDAFDQKSTRPLPFTLLDGSRIDAPMMSQTRSFRYAKGDGYQAVELPYDGGDLAMTILVPDQGKFGQFESSMSGDRLAGIVGELQGRRVELTMPKFKYGASLGLRDVLARMGMAGAFSDGADFSGMSDARDLFISDVVHKAIVDVSETGTEAAAATAVMVAASAAWVTPQEPVVLTVDRPFLFVIRDVPTGAVLFVGRVTNPVEAAS